MPSPKKTTVTLPSPKEAVQDGTLVACGTMSSGPPGPTWVGWGMINLEDLGLGFNLGFTNLGGGFKYFYFHPENWGNDPNWRAYFSDGLVQPPGRYDCTNLIFPHLKLYLRFSVNNDTWLTNWLDFWDPAKEIYWNRFDTSHLSS